MVWARTARISELVRGGGGLVHCSCGGDGRGGEGGNGKGGGKYASVIFGLSEERCGGQGRLDGLHVLGWGCGPNLRGVATMVGASAAVGGGG